MKILLKEKFPGIYSQIDVEKNENINIDKLSHAAGKKIWFKCKDCGNSWKTAVFNRTLNRTRCPYCSHKNPRATVLSSLANLRPDLLTFWDYEKNINITPCEIGINSHKKVWWLCQHNQEHSYLFSIQARSMSKKNHKCPICKKSMKIVK